MKTFRSQARCFDAICIAIGASRHSCALDWLVSLAALIISQPIGFVKMAVVFGTNIATECAQAISSELLARGYSVHCGITKSCEALVSNFPKISFHEFDPDDPDTMEVVATRVLRHSESIDGVISMPERGSLEASKKPLLVMCPRFSIGIYLTHQSSCKLFCPLLEAINGEVLSLLAENFLLIMPE